MKIKTFDSKRVNKKVLNIITDNSMGLFIFIIFIMITTMSY